MRLALAAACMAYVFWGVDLGRLLTTLKLFDPVLVAAMVAATLLSMVPMMFRLDLLSGHALGFGKSAQAILIGQGMNNILPAKLGELVKVFYIRSSTGLRRTRGLELVFWERFSDLNILLALACFVLWATGRDVFLYPLLAVVAGVWAGLLLLRSFPNLGPALIRMVPWQRVRSSLQVFHDEVSSRFRVSFFAGLAIYSLFFWLLAACVTGAGFLAAGISLPLAQWVTVFVVSALGMALPGAPGGLGVYEAAVVVPSMWFGVDKETALALAIVLRAVQYIPVTLVGIIALHFSGLTLKSITQYDEAARDSG